MQIKDLTDKEINKLDCIVVRSNFCSVNNSALKKFLSDLHRNGFDLVRRKKEEVKKK